MLLAGWKWKHIVVVCLKLITGHKLTAEPWAWYLHCIVCWNWLGSMSSRMLIVSGAGEGQRVIHRDQSPQSGQAWCQCQVTLGPSLHQSEAFMTLIDQWDARLLSLSPVTLMATKQSEAKFSVNSKLEGTFCTRLIVRWNKRLGYFHIYCFCQLRTTLYDIYELCKSDVFKFYFILSTNGDIGNFSALCVGLFITFDNGNVIVRFYWPEVSR